MGIAAAIMVPHPPLIIPEVGRGEERKIQHTIDAYLAAARFIAEADPEVIVITSPHSVMYADYFHISPGSAAVGNFGQFGECYIPTHFGYCFQECFFVLTVENPFDYFLIIGEVEKCFLLQV